ncbi:hypothetical protein BDV12DRAFT_197911 [Aspergillus spectabilis]
MSSAIYEATHTISSIIGIQPIIKNKTTGGTGGTDFTVTHDSRAVKTLHVQIAKGSGGWSNRDLVKAIQVTWDDGKNSAVKGNKANADEYVFSFGDDEKVKSMTLRTRERVDKISFDTTDANTFAEGGDNGTAYDQKIGNGVLLGFRGVANSDELVTLGSVFDEVHT